MKNNLSVFFWTILILITANVLFSGCAGNPNTGPTNQTNATHTKASTTTIPAGILLQTVDVPQFGKMIVDGKGMTLYVYMKDELRKSNCYNECAAAWPPLLMKGKLSASDDISADIATAARTDGSMQVTYKGMPIYYFASDTQAGDVAGEGFGGVWFIAGIRQATEPTTSTEMITTTTAKPVPTTLIPTTSTKPSTATTLPYKMNIEVEIQGLAFNPSLVRIGKGGTVTWKNLETVPHTVTSDTGDELSSDTLSKGSTYSHKFDDSGVYAYYCSFHTGMKGMVIVGDALG